MQKNQFCLMDKHPEYTVGYIQVHI